MFGSTSGTGLFGGQQQQQQQQQPAQSGGLFGGGQPQQGGNAGGGLFGSSGGSASGGLFGGSGASGSTGSGGGLFGSSGSTANAGGGGGLFGSTAGNTGNSGGGLFGSSNSTSGGGGLFGNTTNSGGGLFGNSGGNNNNSNSTGGGLFGGSSTNTGGGLFGSSTTGNTGGGMFGSSTTSGGGGLFGQQQQPQQQQQQQQGGLFGQSQQPQQSQLFGQPQQGGFNMAGNGTMMGMQQQQPPPAAAPWWYRELMSVQRAYQPGQGSRFQTMLYEVVGLAPDLLVNSSSIALSHVDSIKTQRKRRVLQDNPWIDEREWQRAEDSNPDPLNWMPTPVVGIEALNKRVEAQAAHVREQLEMLTQPPSRVQVLGKVPSQQQQQQQQPQAPSGGLFGQPQQPQQQQQGQGQSAGQGNGQTPQEQQQLTIISETSDEAKEEVQNDGGKALWLNLEVGEPQEQIEQCRHEHMRLRHRLIKALGRLERLQSASARGGRSEAEIEFDQRLARLDGALSDPRGCRAQLTSIVTQMELENYQDSKLSLSDSRDSGSSSFDNQEQEQMAIFNFLELQRDGIESLMKIVKRDMRDLEIIKRRTMAELPNRYN